MNPATGEDVTKQNFEALSEFRYELRRFLRFSEVAARAEGITLLQYLLLLHIHIKGFQGCDWATIGELAERLQTAPNGVVALVSRCEAAGLVTRVQSEADHRQVEVRIWACGANTAWCAWQRCTRPNSSYWVRS